MTHLGLVAAANFPSGLAETIDLYRPRSTPGQAHTALCWPLGKQAQDTPKIPTLRYGILLQKMVLLLIQGCRNPGAALHELGSLPSKKQRRPARAAQRLLLFRLACILAETRSFYAEIRQCRLFLLTNIALLLALPQARAWQQKQTGVGAGHVQSAIGLLFCRERHRYMKDMHDEKLSARGLSSAMQAPVASAVAIVSDISKRTIPNQVMHASLFVNFIFPSVFNSAAPAAFS